MEDIQTQFDKAYWLSQPPEVRVLDQLAPKPLEADERLTRGTALAKQGFKIDVPIMIWGWDPYKVMKLRLEYGYTWVPNALQPPVGAAPGLRGPGITAYDPNNPPGGAIKVSVNIADYPPFDPPPPAVPTPDPVGPQSVGNVYYSLPSDVGFPDGYKYTDTRGTFIKHVLVSPFGQSHFWEKVQ